MAIRYGKVMCMNRCYHGYGEDTNCNCSQWYAFHFHESSSPLRVGKRLVVTLDMNHIGCSQESLIRNKNGAVFGGSSSKTPLSVGQAWLGRRPDTAKVAGSNPAEPTTLSIAGF